MRNFPELDGLDRREAEKLRRTTQWKVAMQPAIFLGLLAAAGMTALVVRRVLPTESLLEKFFAGALVGLGVVVYMVLVIKPRMQKNFRQQGLPRQE